jgi:Na+/H+-dicarboxylate symporter
MSTHGLTGKILVGMILGIAAGLLLMFYSPPPIQPGDTVRITFADGEAAELAVPAVKKEEKKAPVVFPGGEEAEVILQRPEEMGTVVLPGGASASLAGLSLADAKQAVGEASGREVTKVAVIKRSGVKLLPAATQPFYVVGELFMRLLKMLIVPLIVATVLIGIASLGDIKKMGRMGTQTLLIYAGTMLAATTIGITFVNLINPGEELNWPTPPGTGLAEDQPTVVDLILRIVPSNPVEALAKLDVLGILFFTIMMAFAMLALGKKKVAPVFNFFEGLNDVVYTLIGWVMAIAPLGVGALLAYFIGIQSPELLGTLLEGLGKFALCVILGLLTHFVVLMLAVRLLGGYSPFEFIRKMTPAMATAFGTDSSSATLPVTLSCVRSMGISKRIASFVVPVGATANMNGTALYEATAVLFFAQAYVGFELTIAQQVLVAFTAMLAAVGAAGIPSAGLVTMSLDMMRTVVNVCDDAVASVIVQKWNPDIRAEQDDEATEYEEVDPEASHGQA